jgi:hypothetical protein
MAHPGMTSAILGPRTMQHLDDLLAGAEVRLNDEILDKIDQIVPPGIDVVPNGAAYNPSFTVYAFIRLGYLSEVERFREWGARLSSANPAKPLNVMYSLDGTEAADETDLDHLCGYVRAGTVCTARSSGYDK